MQQQGASSRTDVGKGNGEMVGGHRRDTTASRKDIRFVSEPHPSTLYYWLVGGQK